MINYKNVKKSIDNEKYDVNCKKLENIISNVQNFSIDNLIIQLENFYYAIIISKKYNKNYDDVKKLFYKFTKISQCFDAIFYQFDFLKTTNEKLDFLNEIRITNIELACRVLRKVFDNPKIKDIVRFKKLYCEMCIDIAKINKYNNYLKSDFVSYALKISKELDEVEIYNSLIKIDRNIKQEIIGNMGVIKFSMPQDINHMFYLIEKIIRETISQVHSVNEYIAFFVNAFYVKINGMDFYFCSSEMYHRENNIALKENSILDLVSWNTYDGTKLVKTTNIDGMVNEFIRKEMIKIVIIPMIEEGVNKLGRKEIIEYLCDSCFVFDEDKEDINLALNFYFDGDYRSFVYYIIPNIEKILRNILDMNDIPSYLNSQINPKYQQTFVLSDSLSKLEENDIFNAQLVKLLREKLNDEEYENYRNRLSHKLDTDIFTYDCASDLLRILIVILFCYKKEEDYVSILGDKSEAEVFFKDLMKKI